MVPQEILGIGVGEFITLVVLGVIIFGPEKLPVLARRLARVINYLRGVADGATEKLKTELGPEYADLTAADLAPQRLAKKVLEVEGLQQELADVKAELAQLKSAQAKSVHAETTQAESTQAESAQPKSEKIASELRADAAGLADDLTDGDQPQQAIRNSPKPQD